MRERFLREWAERESRIFGERAFQRQSLPEWDAKWNQLTVQARSTYLHAVKLPERNPIGFRPAPNSPRSDFAPEVLEELAAAGFVRVDSNPSSATFDRVLPGNGTSDFAWRSRILRRMHLLDPHQRSEFSKYVEEVCYTIELVQTLSGILRKVGFGGHYYQLDDIIKRYVVSHRWHEWVVRSIENPLAQPILKLVKESGGAMPLFDLTSAIKGSKPDEVRQVARPARRPSGPRRGFPPPDFRIDGRLPARRI